MKDTQDTSLQELTNACERSEDLIAYLYDEATQSEAADFQNHLRHCTDCLAEMEAFGVVRDSIGEWRKQALGVAPSTVFAAASATASASSKEGFERRRSAIAAIREFLTLSPGWMRAATAAAALLFCALTIVAVVYFSQQPKVLVVEKPMSVAPSRENVETAKDTSADSATLTTKQENEHSQPVVASDNPRTQRTNGRRATAPAQIANRRRQALPQKISEPTTELSAANDFLPFTVPSAEDKLPSLVDLADEPN